jgi:hypothetical protein
MSGMENTLLSLHLVAAKGCMNGMVELVLCVRDEYQMMLN